MPGAVKLSKNAKRRAAKKAQKLEANHPDALAVKAAELPQQPESDAPSRIEAQTDGVQSNGITDDGSASLTFESDLALPLDLDESNPLYEQFKDVLGRFQQSDETSATKEEDKPQVYFDDDDDIPDEEEEAAQNRLSKKKRKELNKLSIAELKALVRKPELVEWTDTSASDPRLLVAIKAQRNVVPVPTHWQLKREYLSSKRGIEKAAFSLPKFIQETGIAEMRDAVLEKQNEATLKQKQRERVAPKMGKLDIDYQKLYEAFFRFQTKPELTRFGEVYYEGKEYETNLRHLRPGELSEDLKEALSIPPGAPAPWLINQQRHGPPPSYPALKIPGLNAPPPPGATWGYHPGGYGKPPTDEFNRPLFGGDLFGTAQAQQAQPEGEPVEKTLWGELQEPDEESEEEDDDDEDEDEDAEEDVRTGLQTPSGLETPGGMASTVPTDFGGVESVSGEFSLRKQRRGTETEESSAPRSAGTVLREKSIKTEGFFGGERAYDINGSQNQSLPVLGQEDNRRKRKVGDVDVSVDVDALMRDDKLSKDEVKRQFEAGRQEQKNPWGAMNVDSDDLSAMIQDEARKRQKKDDERRTRR